MQWLGTGSSHRASCCHRWCRSHSSSPQNSPWRAVLACLVVQVLRVGGGNPNGTGEKRSEKDIFLKGGGSKRGNLGSVFITLHRLPLRGDGLRSFVTSRFFSERREQGGTSKVQETEPRSPQRWVAGAGCSSLFRPRSWLASPVRTGQRHSSPIRRDPKPWRRSILLMARKRWQGKGTRS